MPAMKNFNKLYCEEGTFLGHFALPSCLVCTFLVSVFCLFFLFLSLLNVVLCV